MTTEVIVQGQRVRLLASRAERGVLLDTWEHLDQAPGSSHRTGYVATFPVGQDWDVDSMPDGPVATGYDDHPSQEPLLRFQEALRQEHERARERLTGGHFEQVHPPAN